MGMYSIVIMSVCLSVIASLIIDILVFVRMYFILQVGKGKGSSVVVKVVNSPNFVKLLPPTSGAPVNRNQVKNSYCVGLCVATFKTNNFQIKLI